MLRDHRHARSGVFLHVQLHFVADYPAFLLCIKAVGAFDRLDIAALVADTGANKGVGVVDFFGQLERPVLRHAVLGIVDTDLDAELRALAIGSKCTSLDLVTRQ
ncbi:hypothetical protein D3C81_2024270 [compost metagenome]